MIKIKVNKENENYKSISIKGHAGYAEEGYDIVCASVSSIAITTINAIISIDKDSIVYSEEDGLIELGILKSSDIINKLLDNMVNMLNELKDQYKKYIEIR